MASLLLIGTLAGQPAMNADVTLMINGTEYQTHTKRLELKAGNYEACFQIKDQPKRCRRINLKAGTENTVEMPLDQ